MRLPVDRALATLTAAALSALPLPGLLLPAHAAPPSAEAQATLRKGFSAAQEGLYANADNLFGASISEWEKTGQPAEELATLYMTRGGVRQEAGKLADARTDLSKALNLMQRAGSSSSPAEIQRTFQLRARVNAALGSRREQVDDLSAAIARLDELDAIEATNPYLYSERVSHRL